MSDIRPSQNEEHMNRIVSDFSQSAPHVRAPSHTSAFSSEAIADGLLADMQALIADRTARQRYYRDHQFCIAEAAGEVVAREV
jgi:hypothetical protein